MAIITNAFLVNLPTIVSKTIGSMKFNIISTTYTAKAVNMRGSNSPLLSLLPMKSFNPRIRNKIHIT